MFSVWSHTLKSCPLHFELCFGLLPWITWLFTIISTTYHEGKTPQKETFVSPLIEVRLSVVCYRWLANLTDICTLGKLVPIFITIGRMWPVYIPFTHRPIHHKYAYKVSKTCSTCILGVRTALISWSQAWDLLWGRLEYLICRIQARG